MSIQVASSDSPLFWRGVAASVPIVVASAPFGILFGVLAVQNGMTVFEATLMSALVYAGASQLVGLELFGQNLPAWLVVFSIFAVNFRHVLYSGSLGRQLTDWSLFRKAWAFFFLVDAVYAESEQRLERREPVTISWFMGMASMVYLAWVLNSVIGAEFGSRFLPDNEALGIDFLLPIYFFGLVMGFRKRPRWLPVVLASAIGSIVAYETIGSPWHVSIGALAGVLLAAFLPASPSRPRAIEVEDPSIS